jgi:hypothetical protein
MLQDPSSKRSKSTIVYRCPKHVDIGDVPAEYAPIFPTWIDGIMCCSVCGQPMERIDVNENDMEAA